MKNKSKITKTLLFIFSIAFAACSDWTEIEGIDIKQSNIADQNPELYNKYLEQVREYKKSEHKKVYAWYDNSEKVPFNRAQHLTSLPDSIDVVILMHPDHLVDIELREMTEIKEKKGTKVIYTINFDAIKSIHSKRLELAPETEPVTKDFQSFLLDTLEHSLSLANKYNYDGICIGYNGKSILHMREDEAREYKSNERLFIGIISDWYKRNADKSIDYAGKPQNLQDKTLLKDCNMIMISGQEATTKNMFTYYLTVTLGEGIPTDRLGMVVSTTSIDTADKETGFLSNGTRALEELAEWAIVPCSGVEVAGIGIYNVSTDYYNPSMVYKCTRTAISTLNPSIK